MFVHSKRSRRILSASIALIFAFTALGLSTVSVNAAAKTKSITLKVDVPGNVIDVKGKAIVSVKSVKPAKASKKVTWKSSDKAIASVTAKGVVTGKKIGTVKITAISKVNKKVTKSVTIKVKNLKPESVSLNKTSAVLYERGDSLKLTAKVKPAGLYDRGVTYTSSDSYIASVSSKGIVSPKHAGTAVITAKTKESGKTAKCTVTVKESANKDILLPYMLTGYYAADRLNYVDIAPDADVKVWDAASDTYKDGKNNKATILGNYVQLTDKNKDQKADLIQVVKFADSSKKWDAGMEWKNGAGENAEPAVSDETGKAMFENAEYRIPMGERLLTGWGLGDYSGTTDFSNLEKSTYWPDYDYYNTKSSDTLTILPGYKTQLQTTGWTCVLSSALSALEWYGVRGDLNEEDLAALRSDTRKRMAGATSLKELNNVFKKLEELKITGAWNIESSLDSEEARSKIYDPAWIKGHLEKGHPIMVIWNSYGGHGQVIIGYDDMGTEATNDDTLIMMDPYDSTDHNANGYIIQSFERLAYGLSDEEADGIAEVRYLVASPKEGWNYQIDRSGTGIPDQESNIIKSSDKNKLNEKLYEQTKLDLSRWYLEKTDPGWIYLNEKTGLGGPAGIERSGDYNHSPYYNFYDFYNGQGPTDTLDIIKNYKTIQQSTEWTCGCTSATMVLEHFNKNYGKETDISLSHLRQKGEAGPTYLSGMEEIFTKMNSMHADDWVWFTRNDLTNPDGEESAIGDYYLQYGSQDNGLIPYLIEKDIPIMIGWDEWGGHWQTIIGYDDMGTAQTQDDVLILADSYDTTDHDQDGYYIESFERLVFGWNAQFEKEDGGFDSNNFIVAFPRTGNEDVVKALNLK